ncbi:phosphatase PAP2 family protein [Paenactinomyces guangxiensis]|uniref:Phosphatase PAP2 family protein n=1 Tax=Paenactinomyces guangxiensis TaxID=1490290 RepID=A0A7W1WTA2_9BACL|nr:phosphatase PAP2 family protein [Paenactinomyces guangxiensis]MBA4495598.1 phosphatase PAP2 family protein [Paenactinomyces guangxiensis]MBH8592586.1 phosphatase PAP2 family protein [Paenactinomyces guangxiensis]
MLAGNLAGAWLLNITLKSLIQRPRPNLQHLIEVDGYSYPSGHAMVAAAFYGMIGYLVWFNLRTKGKPSWYEIVFTVLLILAIGTSRVYLGVHYPSDVIAGFAAGGVWLVACIKGLNILQYYKRN